VFIFCPGGGPLTEIRLPRGANRAVPLLFSGRTGCSVEGNFAGYADFSGKIDPAAEIRLKREGGVRS
jgi:hypothetical protein